MGAARLQRLVKRAIELVVVADRLACGLHLGGKVGIKAAELVEREHGDLDVPALLFLGVDVEEALLFERLTHDDLGGDIGKTESRCLGQERHGTRGSGVDLDDVNVLFFIDDELNVEQSNDADAKAELLCVLQNRALDLVRN